MLRKAFVMQVNADQYKEYERRHSPIWQELKQTLKAHGTHNYSIYFQPEANLLFAYVEVEDEDRWNQIANTDACQRWWRYMSDIMPSNPDGSPISVDLREVFHLD